MNKYSYLFYNILLKGYNKYNNFMFVHRMLLYLAVLILFIPSHV